MVFGMARQSGGTVTIASEPGHGTSVTILLRPAEGAKPSEATPRQAAPADLATIAGLKVLIVDDEPIVRQVVSQMLVDLGCVVVAAEDGETALKMIEQEAPAALLLDFAMPGMNGAEVARAALARDPNLRIVFATGFAQSDAIDAVLGDRAIVLRKPFSPNTLAHALQSAIA
jgi:CheY-like chemotaxis protein